MSYLPIPKLCKAGCETARTAASGLSGFPPLDGSRSKALQQHDFTDLIRVSLQFSVSILDAPDTYIYLHGSSICNSKSGDGAVHLFFFESPPNVTEPTAMDQHWAFACSSGSPSATASSNWQIHADITDEIEFETQQTRPTFASHHKSHHNACDATSSHLRRRGFYKDKPPSWDTKNHRKKWEKWDRNLQMFVRQVAALNGLLSSPSLRS